MSTQVEQALDILNKLAYEKYDKGEYAAAIVYYNRYLELNQSNPIVYNMLGYLYQKLGGKYNNLNEQVQFFEKAISLDSSYVQALRNLALAYPLVGKYQEAVECFHKIFKLGPVMDDYMAYACLQIRLENFKEGWKYYEYRFLKEYSPTEYPKINKPRWEGQKIPDKTLLVQYEQGFGDSIQFYRFLEQVKPLVKKIVFRVQNELVDLFKVNASEIEVVGIATPLDELSFDYHIPLMSLPFVLKFNSIDDIPLSQGYIKADKNKVKQYKKNFFNNDCLKIGICWNGTKFGNRNRNIPLEYFYPLTEIKNVVVYSFQKGFGSNQLQELPPNIKIVDLGKTFKDFSDTAAAMENLDFFVTSDNGVFNLAGAMGKKTFVLMNKYSEWRWFLDDKFTPWYSNAEIFKKSDENEDWDLLINKIVEKIGQHI